MTFNNLPTVAVAVGLAAIVSFGGCCTSGSCGSSGAVSSSTQQVYSAPSYAEAPASDCGCGCSAAADSGMSYESSGTVMDSQFYSPPEFSSATPTSAVGETTSSFSASSPVVEAPSIGENSGFTAGSSSKDNALPGNLLPGN